MSYFKKINFETPEAAKPPTPTTITFDKKKLKAAISKVQQEIINFQIGKSTLSHYTWKIKDGQSPATNALQMFIQTPTAKTLDTFEKASASEWGLKVSQAMSEWISESIEGATDEKNK